MDPMDPSAFVVVRDIAASWVACRTSGLVLPAGSVDGLILQAAGPTDEGCRTIEVWASDAAYRRHEVRDLPGLLVPPVVRSLHAHHLVGGRSVSPG